MVNKSDSAYDGERSAGSAGDALATCTPPKIARATLTESEYSQLMVRAAELLAERAQENSQMAFAKKLRAAARRKQRSLQS